MPRKRTDFIIIHCSATPPSMDIGAKEIDGWHRARGWLKIGYHKVVRRDGTIEDGRGLWDAGAHAKGYNSRSVGICMVGGVAEKGKRNEGHGFSRTFLPEKNFTDCQWRSLRALIDVLLEEFPMARVIGHNEISSKDCPSWDLDTTPWLRERSIRY